MKSTKTQQVYKYLCSLTKEERKKDVAWIKYQSLSCDDVKQNVETIYNIIKTNV